MITFTLLSPRGEPLGRNLPSEDAVDRLLTHDGSRYEILPEDGGTGFVLWIVAPGGLPARTAFVSAESDRSRARDEIFALVIAASNRQHGPTLVNDADYEMWLSGYENE